MGLKIVGEDPLGEGGAGKRAPRIATLFPRTATLVTLPGIHATQRLAYVDLLNQERAERGLPKLTRAEEDAETANSVDLILEGSSVLIRPDPSKMALAFQADELLQERVAKHRVKFLYVRNEKVHDAIQRRGECWRVTPLPKSSQELKEMIAASRIGIHGEAIYYYSRPTGARFLTCQQFAALACLDDDGLRRHLAEIREFSARINARGKPEVGFFMADKSFSKADPASHDFQTLAPEELRGVHEWLAEKFRSAVPPELREDDPESLEWRNAMCAALLGHEEEEVVSEETLLGLSSEFFMQIQWLPGGRIEEGELIFDPIFEQGTQAPRDQEVERLYDEKSRGFIYNFVREYGDLEYVNIGRVIGSLSRKRPMQGRRQVYIAEVKQRGSQKEILCIIRMQKWGVCEHLDEEHDLLEAILASEEYTEYVLDRRLGCRQLGMAVPTRVTGKRIPERYFGKQTKYHGRLIWTAYFEREYIPGIASDKIPNHRFQSEVYASGFARLLGRAAAPNMIVGRCDSDDQVLFDDGDEVVLENDQGMPTRIIVSDPTGCFADYRHPFEEAAAEYAEPVNRRAECLPDPRMFAGVYLDAFVERFSAIQAEYRRRRRAFDTLFRHCQRDEGGSFAYRWEQVLQRLNNANPRRLADLIRSHMKLK
ncbi:MAG TPA: hypothetical protein VMY37_22830 [Thermoguttaceae bacterium]|nr:hypothetical protein [Thermoguttaceae bacterium]